MKRVLVSCAILAIVLVSVISWLNSRRYPPSGFGRVQGVVGPPLLKSMSQVGMRPVFTSSAGTVSATTTPDGRFDSSGGRLEHSGR